MFIAMNRFKIVLGKEKDFEDVWRKRDSYLDDVDGFKEFNLLLIGKDGDEKYNSKKPVSINVIYEVIDSMPMRKQEIKERN